MEDFKAPLRGQNQKIRKRFPYYATNSTMLSLLVAEFSSLAFLIPRFYTFLCQLYCIIECDCKDLYFPYIYK